MSADERVRVVGYVVEKKPRVVNDAPHRQFYFADEHDPNDPDWWIKGEQKKYTVTPVYAALAMQQAQPPTAQCHDDGEAINWKAWAESFGVEPTRKVVAMLEATHRTAAHGAGAAVEAVAAAHLADACQKHAMDRAKESRVFFDHIGQLLIGAATTIRKLITPQQRSEQVGGDGGVCHLPKKWRSTATEFANNGNQYDSGYSHAHHKCAEELEATCQSLAQQSSKVKGRKLCCALAGTFACRCNTFALSTQPLPQPAGVSDAMVERANAAYNDACDAGRQPCPNCRGTHRERDNYTECGTCEGSGWKWDEAAPRPMKAALQAALHPDQAKDGCDHDWHVWPETDGLEQKCMSCGKYRRTP